MNKESSVEKGETIQVIVTEGVTLRVKKVS